MFKYPIIPIVLISLVIYGLAPTQAKSKPYTQCFKRTIPNMNLWHAASCKDLIDRISGESYVY